MNGNGNGNDKQASPPPGSPTPLPPRPVFCPPFHPATLQFQMTMDAAVRWGAVALLAAAMIFASAAGSARWPYLLAVMIGIAWIAVSVASAKVWQMIPRITLLLDQSPALAEAHLADALRRWALHRTVRLLLYHRLAVLRHRQQRFAEAAAICQSLLSLKLGAARQVESHLLLLLAECQLLSGDLHGAWHALSRLAPMRLSLVESAQRIALRTRYEIAAGYYQLAVTSVREKVELSEMMPAPQCGAMHAMLAFAARHCDHAELADWLQQRADLLCAPEQMQALSASGALITSPHR